MASTVDLAKSLVVRPWFSQRILSFQWVVVLGENQKSGTPTDPSTDKNSAVGQSYVAVLAGRALAGMGGAGMFSLASIILTGA